MSSLAIISSAVLITACGDGDRANTVTEQQVKEQYIKIASAAYTDSLSTAVELQTAVNIFTTSPTEANLNAARNAYKSARVPYQQSEIMRFDSAITVGKNLNTDGGPASVDDWEGQVNAWPLDENHIVSLIEGNDVINTQLLLAQNGVNDQGEEKGDNVTTGIHAIEFLLWDEDTNGTNPGAGNRQAIAFDTTNCPDDFCQRRIDYLTTATDLYVADLTEMNAEWTSTAIDTSGTLAYNFINSDDAVDYILNAMLVMATDELASARIGTGLFTGDTEEEHDCFSDLSHLAIYYNFQGVKNAFYGDYWEVEGPGIGDLIKQKDEETYQRIDTALVSIEAKMFEIFELGERETNPIRFDQIIGQPVDGVERVLAQSASNELIALDTEFTLVRELLSLEEINTGGSGD